MNTENKCITHPEYGTGTIRKVEKVEEGYWVTVDLMKLEKRSC